MAKICVVSGSRNPEGQTARAVDALVEGIKTGRGEAEKFFLPEMNIERCRQCNADGWGQCRDGSGCVIDDDLGIVMDAIIASAGVVFATPVYYSDIAESLRAFLDRFRRVRTKGGADERVSGMPAILVAVAGGGGGGAPRCILEMEKIIQTIGFSIRDAVPVRRQNLDLKCKVLELTGKWFAGECV